MQSNRKLLKSLRDDFKDLRVFDNEELDRLRRRGEMLVRRLFRADSPYIQELANIAFSRVMPFAISSSGSSYPSSESRRQARENTWRSGQTKVVNLVNAMLEELELDDLEQVEGAEVLPVQKSKCVFVVHGHDGEM
jgi:hypothetical protein